MKLNPVPAKPKPEYPTYQAAKLNWRKIAAAIAASAALWLPACGDNATGPERLSGTPRSVEQVRLPGEAPAQNLPQPDVEPPKPPEPPVLPTPEPRLAGRMAPPTPPTPIVSPRTAGARALPRHPNGSGTN